MLFSAHAFSQVFRYIHSFMVGGARRQMMFGSHGFIHEAATQPAFKETRDATTVWWTVPTTTAWEETWGQEPGASPTSVCTSLSQAPGPRRGERTGHGWCWGKEITINSTLYGTRFDLIFLFCVFFNENAQIPPPQKRTSWMCKDRHQTNRRTDAYNLYLHTQNTRNALNVKYFPQGSVDTSKQFYKLLIWVDVNSYHDKCHIISSIKFKEGFSLLYGQRLTNTG